ncbi:unnamed protein product, partial [Phaeothamnion confervicola]
MATNRVSAVASAPGKVILFGEHAVVHGKTAIAAAASDLRLVVTAEGKDVPQLEVVLPDLTAPTGGPLRYVREMGELRCLRLAVAGNGGPVAPAPKDKQVTAALEELLVGETGRSHQALAPVLFLCASLLPELILGVSEDGVAGNVAMGPPGTCRGIVVTAQSVSLPIGAGLGSSAALCTASAAALLRFRSKLKLPTAADAAAGNGAAADPPEATGGSTGGCRCGRDCGNGSGCSGGACGCDAGSRACIKYGGSSSGGGCNGVSAGAAESVQPDAAALKVINDWAFAAEVLIHGDPSGLDNTVSCYGGVIEYVRRPLSTQVVAGFPALEILLINTGVPRQTRQLVAAVGELHRSFPKAVGHIFDSIDAISRTFLSSASTVAVAASAASEAAATAGSNGAYTAPAAKPAVAMAEGAASNSDDAPGRGSGGNGCSSAARHDESIGRGAAQGDGAVLAKYPPSAAGTVTVADGAGKSMAVTTAGMMLAAAGKAVGPVAARGLGQAATAAAQAQAAKTEAAAEAGRLMTVNHHLLCALGVGHESLDRAVAVSARHGAACKLTGAGGGGCAIALVSGLAPMQREQLVADLTGDGMMCFETALGGSGVLWHG